MAGPLVSQKGTPTGPFKPGIPTTDVGSQYNLYVNVTTSLSVVLVAAVLAMPFAVFGMVVSWCIWKLTRPTWLTAFIMSATGVLCVLLLSREVAWFWPWGLIIPGRLYDILPVTSTMSLSNALLRSSAIELCSGPVLLLAWESMLGFREQTLLGGIFRQAQEKRNIAHEADTAKHMYARSMNESSVDAAHPNGRIRLGVFKTNRTKMFDLTVGELGLHTFLPGATGSGKTTTLERLADGAMASGSGLVIIDCKGGSLGATAKKLAARHGLPFIVVDPDDPATVGYNPCTGSPSDVANKLIGSFAFGEAGEIYKQVGMNVIPLVVKGLMATGATVTLVTIAEALDANGLRLLAKKVDDLVPDSDEANSDPNGRALRALADQLRDFVGDADVAGKNGVSGLKFRLGALVQGSFGPLFDVEKELDWDAVFATPSVVYVSLPVTAASEDVELLGRVIIQDLKQACGRRLRAGSESLAPTLIAIDEFAALKDAKQIIDLLLQARQAKMPLVLSTQLLPQDPDLRSAVLQAGLLIAHRLQAADAEEIAAQFGTRSSWKVTHQIDWETAQTQKGTIRDVDEYVVHPNTLRQLPQGTAAVRSVQTARWGIVEVLQTT
jgi:hypothetical protein